MDRGIGETLRAARSRRKLSLSEVEAAIRIRARYLGAIEDEEWEALPGGAYTRAFIRTYANHLGLDGERLAAEHAPQPEAAPAGDGAGGRRGRLSPRVATALVVVALVALALAVGLATGGGGGEPSPAPESSGAGAAPGRVSHPAAVGVRDAAGVELSLATTAEVWVCVLDANGRPLVEGQVLQGGAEEGPFHSGSFTVAFGNGEVAMRIDGKDIRIPASASPLGYSIDSGGRLTPLAEAERPTCL